MSCGISGGEPVLDLDYAEDSAADADANFVLTDAGGIVEIQATAEKTRVQRGAVPRACWASRAQGTAALFAAQREAVDAA